MIRALLPLFLLCTQIASAQEFVIELDDHDPFANDSDLNRLDQYFDNVRLIGLGESTHGTHEFFTMRHRLIRYLSENHEFNTVFMEADFANSLVIDEYIKGNGGTAEDAVKNLGLWPWITQEMVDMVKWLKGYNESHPSNQISFVGVDVQKFDETVRRLEQLVEKYNLTPRVNKNVDANAFYKLSKKEVLELRSVEISWYNKLDTSNFLEKDQYEYRWLFRHLNQILSEKLEKKSNQTTYRDKMMAENILKHMAEKEESRGVFWAHNGHIANLFSKKKHSGVAGGYLKKALVDRYFILGQEFDQGTFNARVRPTDYINDSDWVLKEVEVGESPAGSFAANLRMIRHPFVFMAIDELPAEETLYINSIGAIWYTNKEGEASEFLRKNHHGRKAFDGMILIKESTPTQMLDR